MANRSILLTGATGKVGLALLKSLVEEEHYVIAVSRNKLKALELYKSNNLSLEKVHIIEANLFNDNDVKKLVDSCSEIDSIIFNARSVEFLSSNEEGEISKENFSREIELACVIPYLISNEVIKRNRSLRDIVYISSMYGVVAPNTSLYENFKKDSPINYGVAKAAQIHLTKEQAVRLAPDIRVNAISYGGIEGRVDESFQKRYSKLTPMGQMLGDEDLYPPVRYLLENPDLKITGQNLIIDGGWTIW